MNLTSLNKNAVILSKAKNLLQIIFRSFGKPQDDRMFFNYDINYIISKSELVSAKQRILNS